MVKLRLKRLGTKKRPVYRIIAIDSKNRRDGRALEEIGFYDPRQEPSLVKFKTESVQKWLSMGAQPTETVARLLKREALLGS